MRTLALSLTLALFLCELSPRLRAEELIIASPGSPAAGEEASRIASSLARQLLGESATGRYEFDLTACDKALAERRPTLVLLSLPYYLERVAKGEALQPLLCPLIKGRTDRAFVLLRRKDAGPISLDSLTEVETELAWAPSFVHHQLLGGHSPRLEPVKRLLRSLKSCLGGSPDCLLVDEDQWAAAQAIPELAKGLHVIHKSPALPAAVLALASSAKPESAEAIKKRGLSLSEKATREENSKRLLESLGFDGFITAPTDKIKVLTASPAGPGPKSPDSEGED
jgi:hypothetical protein